MIGIMYKCTLYDIIYCYQQTVCRANEVNVHAALRQENILPLVAVLMGERHEYHKSKFYCFHFMPVMDCDFRQFYQQEKLAVTLLHQLFKRAWKMGGKI